MGQERSCVACVGGSVASEGDDESPGSGNSSWGSNGLGPQSEEHFRELSLKGTLGLARWPGDSRGDEGAYGPAYVGDWG